MMYAVFETVDEFREYILNPESGFKATENSKDILESSLAGKDISSIYFKTANEDVITVYYLPDKSRFWGIEIETQENSIYVKCKKKSVIALDRATWDRTSSRYLNAIIAVAKLPKIKNEFSIDFRRDIKILFRMNLKNFFFENRSKEELEEMVETL